MIAGIEKRQIEQAKFLAAHPEVAAEALHGKKKK